MSERNFRILVVDDTQEVRELLRFTLLAGGYECLVAEDGPAGLKVAASQNPDLILLDLMMPGMDGYEVCRQLKSVPSTRRVPIIFLTARSEVVDRVRGLGLGAVDYVSKPFDPRELLARVDVALRTKAALDSLERANQELRTTSSTDALTGLYNRRYFEERLSEELANPERLGVAAACLLLDLDHLKQINDTHGHFGGDAALRGLAQAIQQVTRRGDLAARFAGDEFALLLFGVTAQAAWTVAEKVRSTIAATVLSIEGTPVQLTTSIGVASFKIGPRFTLKRILEEADRALYRAKATRNCVDLIELID